MRATRDHRVKTVIRSTRRWTNITAFRDDRVRAPAWTARGSRRPVWYSSGFRRHLGLLHSSSQEDRGNVMRRQQIQALLPIILILTVIVAGILLARGRWSKHAPSEPSTERLSTGPDVPGWLVSRLDPQDPPPDRLEHFDWLNHSPTRVQIEEILDGPMRVGPGFSFRTIVEHKGSTRMDSIDRITRSGSTGGQGFWADCGRHGIQGDKAWDPPRSSRV